MSDGDDPRSPAGPASAPPRWAADEPTAMWDEEALRKRGFGAVSDAHATAAGTPPATARAVDGDEVAGVRAPAPHASEPASRPAPPASEPASRPAAPAVGLSWPATIALAIAVAVITFVVVRMLR